MKYDFNKVFLSTVVLFFVSFFSATPVFAQTSEGLEIKPAIVEESINPGDTRQFAVSVKNISDSSKIFYLQTEDIKGLDSNGLPVFAPEGESTGFELSSWIVLPQSSVSFGPGETRSIIFTAKVPLNASPGSHFGGIFFSEQPLAQETSGSSVALKVGPIVSMRIAGDIRESARLREISTGKLIYRTPTVDLQTKVENTGNVLVRPRGLIQITNMLGKEVGTIPVNDSVAPVFPGADRVYGVSWTYNGFAFGRYQAIVTLSYGEEAQKTISGTTSFWILPLVPITVLIGSLLVLILTVYGLMRFYLKKKLAEMGVSSATKSDAEYYGRKYQKSNSKLMVVVLSLAVVSVGILILLFIMFA